MGKGDKKTKRGKLFQGSYGVRRRKNSKKDKNIVAGSLEKPANIEVKTIKEVKEPVKEVKTPAKEPKPAKEAAPKSVKEAATKPVKAAAAKKEPKSKS